MNGPSVLARNASEAITEIDRFDQLRNTLGYPTDGVVLRVDDFALQDQLGVTASQALPPPLGHKSVEVCSSSKCQPKLLVWLNGSRATEISPPGATMAPVLLGGHHEVQHASLHNIEEIERKDIRIGDTVLVEKAGEII